MSWCKDRSAIVCKNVCAIKFVIQIVTGKISDINLINLNNNKTTP